MFSGFESLLIFIEPHFFSNHWSFLWKYRYPSVLIWLCGLVQVIVCHSHHLNPIHCCQISHVHYHLGHFHCHCLVSVYSLSPQLSTDVMKTF